MDEQLYNGIYDEVSGLFIIKNYPRRNNEVRLESPAAAKWWLIKRIITFSIAVIAGIALAIYVNKEAEFIGVGFKIFMWILTLVFGVCIAYALRKCASTIISMIRADDGNVFVICIAITVVVLLGITVIIPIIWMIKEIKLLVNLSNTIKEVVEPETHEILTVYWADGVENFHMDPDCEAFDEVETLISGSIKEAEQAGHTHACRKCGN